MTDETNRLETLIDWETRVKNAYTHEKEAQTMLDQCKEDTVNARKKWEQAVGATGAAIDGEPGNRPLIDVMEATESDNLLWRPVRVASVEGFSQTIVKHLETAGLTTLGKLTDHGEKYELTDVKGIGAGMAKTIEDALADYWAARKA